MSEVVAYVAGVATLPALLAVSVVVSRAMSRSSWTWCPVEGQDHASSRLPDGSRRTEIGNAIWWRRHRWATRRDPEHIAYFAQFKP